MGLYLFIYIYIIIIIVVVTLYEITLEKFSHDITQIRIKTIFCEYVFVVFFFTHSYCRT